MTQEPLVFTEVFGCGQMAQSVVTSFLAHHDKHITVLGSPDDLCFVPRHPRVEAIAPTKSDFGVAWERVTDAYLRGHRGTAVLWSGLLRSSGRQSVVHVDSDLIFLGNAVDLVQEALESGAALAGPRRPQFYNVNGRDDVRGRPDTLHTFCIGINSTKLPWWPQWLLERNIEGRRTSLRRPLDFFDPVTSAVIRRGGKVTYLDSPEAGDSAKTDLESGWLAKLLILPSAAASGCARWNRGETQPTDPYGRAALRSWSWFAFHILGIETHLDRDEHPELEELLRRIDPRRWTITR